jgi:hypothetical protein
MVEKLNPLDRKSAPGRVAAVTSLAVVVISCVHVPLPTALIFEGVNLHNAELVDVEQEPVYTDISPLCAMTGVNATLSLATKGKFEVRVFNCSVSWARYEEILRDTKRCASPEDGRKTYAIFLLLVEN